MTIKLEPEFLRTSADNIESNIESMRAETGQIENIVQGIVGSAFQGAAAQAGQQVVQQMRQDVNPIFQNGQQNAGILRDMARTQDQQDGDMGNEITSVLGN